MATSSSSTASSSATGGTGASCGDGAVEPPEQCDDGGTDDGDGCDADCRVECSYRLHPETFHCYVLNSSPFDWSLARSACEVLGPGWSLAGIVDAEELSWVVDDPAVENRLASDHFIWIGGEDQVAEGQFEYVNGEPFPVNLWHPGQPDDAGIEDCVDLWKDANVTLFNDDDCDDAHASLCERRPPGTKL